MCMTLGRTARLYYIVMELVEGITFEEYIDKRRKAFQQKPRNITVQMCTGIGVAIYNNIIP